MLEVVLWIVARVLVFIERLCDGEQVGGDRSASDAVF
jgi:hypothetical protein